MAKMTKAAAKRRMKEIDSKAQKLFMGGYLSQTEYATIQKMMKKGISKC